MRTAGLLPLAVVLWAAGPAPARADICPEDPITRAEEAQGLAAR
jgi:hypothetical protein